VSTHLARTPGVLIPARRDERRLKDLVCLGGGLCLAMTMGSCGTMPGTSGDKKSDELLSIQASGQSLRRQTREREKRIAELESQLDALKVIDQDVEK
jgi:hypothetical protein